MPVTTVGTLMDRLRDSQLLPPAHLHLLTTDPEILAKDPQGLAELLVHRQWLTAWQTEQLLQEDPPSLLLGAYVLLEPLGEGGMGQVFKARHQLLDRVVALKVIRQDRLANDPEAVRRFQREARAAALLAHPNVVLVFDADRVGDTYFIAMQYVEGIDLGRLVKENGPLPVPQACEYIRQAALGLQHAHEHGMVHRDIKPSNLLVTQPAPPKPETGSKISIGAAPAIPNAPTPAPTRTRPSDRGQAPVVKILDMGLVRLGQTVDPNASGGSLTQEGTMVGTPDYISPEQARNAHRVDIRADLYSLGATFYYLLTGQPPFPEGSVIEKLLMHQLDEPRPIEEMQPQVPPKVTAIIRKLLAKRPEDRYQTPAEVAEVLASLSVRDNIPSRPRSVSVNERTPPATPVNLTRPTLPGKSFQGTSSLPPATPKPAESSPPPTRPKSTPPVTPRPIEPSSPSFSIPPIPGEKSPAKPSSGNDSDELTPASLVSASVYRWSESAGVSQGGSEPAKLLAVLKGHTGCVMSVGFSSDRDTLASGGVDGSVRIWDFRGSKPRERAVLQTHLSAVHSLAFSADNKVLASGSGGVDGQIWLWDMTQDVPRARAVVDGHHSPVDALAFSPDGKMLVSGGHDVMVRLWDVGVTEFRPRTVLKGHVNAVKSVTFSPDGQTVASGSQDYTVRLWTVGRMWCKERAVLDDHEGHVHSVVFSPDSKLLATASLDQTGRIWDMSESKPKERFVLQGHSGVVRRVIFTADSKFVVSVCDGRQAFQFDVETGKKVREWQLPKSLMSSFCFTQDGRYLATGNSDGPVMVYRLGSKRSSQGV